MIHLCPADENEILIDSTPRRVNFQRHTYLGPGQVRNRVGKKLGLQYFYCVQRVAI